jgi:hypothetical protein
MGWQEMAALAIVAATASIFLWKTMQPSLRLFIANHGRSTKDRFSSAQGRAATNRGYKHLNLRMYASCDTLPPLISHVQS